MNCLRHIAVCSSHVPPPMSGRHAHWPHHRCSPQAAQHGSQQCRDPAACLSRRMVGWGHPAQPNASVNREPGHANQQTSSMSVAFFSFGLPSYNAKKKKSKVAR